jgi:hypothetical protein
MIRNIGIFGTSRIGDYAIEDFIQIKNDYPLIYRNDTFQINVRPLGYTCSSSDVLQCIELITTNKYKEIKDTFIYNNVLLKHGGKDILIDLNYDFIILEICSLKKIIHKSTGLIFPYEIEGNFNQGDYIYETETFNETIENILKIYEILKCKIILVPPITLFKEEPKSGFHEEVIPKKVLEYRNEIIHRLSKLSTLNKNIYFINWNINIKNMGITKIVEDQFHFTEFGKKYISQYIINFFRDLDNNLDKKSENIICENTLKLFTFCVDIGRFPKKCLLQAFNLLVSSLEYYVKDYKLILFTNFELKTNNKNVEIRKYYNVKSYFSNNSDGDQNWYNLNFNRFYIYKDLYDEYKEDYTWIDLDTVVVSDIRYINNLSNVFIENGKIPLSKSDEFCHLFSNTNECKILIDRYIQGNLWKINIDLYNKLTTIFEQIKMNGLILRYDFQDLLNFYINIIGNNEINIIGKNILKDVNNGLSIWSRTKLEHGNIEGLSSIYFDNEVCKTLNNDKIIHIISFTFYTLNKLYNTSQFNNLFGHLLKNYVI